MEENQKRHRLKPEVGVELSLADGQRFSGKTRNVSFGGVFVGLSPLPKLRPGDECRVTVVLGPGRGEVRIPIRSAVVHVQPDGVGLKFLEIALEHYETFKNFMVANSDDPNRLLEELKHKPGIMPTG